MTERLPQPRFRVSRIGRRSLLKPQHRIVLGLVAMSAGALLMTLLNPPEPASPAPLETRPEPTVPPRGDAPAERVDVPLPAVMSSGQGPVAVQERARILGAAVDDCARRPQGFAPADGRLELVVELTSLGLSSARVEGLGVLGADASACLAAALGSAPWPRAEAPVALRMPFYIVQPVGKEDAGESENPVRASSP